MIHVDRDRDTIRILLDLDAARQLREVMVAEWRRNTDRTCRAIAEALTRAIRPTHTPVAQGDGSQKGTA